MSRGESCSSYVAPNKCKEKKALYSFILERKVDKGAEFTHTSMDNPKCAFYVSSEDINEFMDLYKEALKHGEKLHITERHRDIGPIVIDLDFRQGDLTRRYTEEHVIKILQELFVVIDEYLEIRNPKADIFILEKPARAHKSNKDVYKDGLHIIIPDIVTLPDFQYLLRERTMEVIGREVLHDCGYLNKYDDIYDEAVIERNGWLMYGSNKGDEKDKWKIRSIYEWRNGEVIKKEILYSDNELVDVLSIRNKYKKSEYKKVVPDRKCKEDTESNISVTTNRSYIDLEKVEKLVRVLSNARCDGYRSWIDVGMCLQNIDHSLLYVWDNWSKQSPKYEEGVCGKYWKTFKTVHNPMTMGTLCYWAKMDNPDKYSEIMRENLLKLVLLSISETQYDIAMVIHYILKYDYVYVNMEAGSVWYKYENHRWQPCPNGLSLRSDISTKVYREYKRIIIWYNDKTLNASDEHERKNFNDIVQKLTSISQKLKKTSFKNSLEVECREFFMVNKSFIELLDDKKNLLGFTNGVYDLDTGEFTDGRPDDMISLSTKIQYVPEDDEEIQRELLQFMEDIMPNNRMIKHLLTILAYQLHGNKYLEKISFWVGKGRNGKGVLAALFICALGEYCYCPDVAILTTKKTNASSASSEMARAKGVRAMVLSEPSEDDKFQVGKMKSLSGLDKVQARSLFKEFMEWLPQFHITIQMNNKPDTNGFDEAFAERLEIVPFIYRFCSDPKLPNEKKVSDVKERFKRNIKYAEQFMKILLGVYREHVQGGQRPDTPEEIKEATKDYLESINKVGNFIEECLEVTHNKEDIITVEEAYTLYKAYDDDSPLKKTMFKQRMVSSGFKEYKFKGRTRMEFRDKYVYEGLKVRNNVMQSDETDD